MFNLGKGSAPESAWHCCAMAGLPGALNPQSSCRTQLWVPRLGHSLGRRTFGVAKPGSPGRTFGVTMPGSPGRTFGVAKPGSPGSSGPVWVRQCLRCLGGSGSLLFTLRLLTAASWMLDDVCRLLRLFTLLIWHYWSSISPTVLWAKARMTACLLFVCAIFMYVNDWCVCLYSSI